MELELSEGRVYGARYHVVHPVPNWDITGDWGGVDRWNSMVEWCVNTFGPTPKDGVWTPGMKWYVNNARFYFREEADMALFVLRWKK